MKKSVSVIMPEFPVGKVDVRFRVKSGKTFMGELQISQGSLVLFPKNARRGRKVSWEQFVAFAKEHGIQAEER